MALSTVYPFLLKLIKGIRVLMSFFTVFLHVIDQAKISYYLVEVKFAYPQSELACTSTTAASSCILPG